MSLQKSIPGQTDVFLKVAQRVCSTATNNQNSVFSPLSLQVVLNMVTAGSSGSTRDELLGFLKLKTCDELNKLSHVTADGSLKGGSKLKFANGVWFDKRFPLKNSFAEFVDRIYNASIDQVDFLHKANEATTKVNSWAQMKTNGLIKEILSPNSVSDETRLILANALYFKGAWEDKFDASKTKEGDFHLLNGGSVKVPFMTTAKKQFLGTYDDFKVLRLPYEQGKDTNRQFSMYVFLPHERDGLPALMDKLSSQPNFLNEHLPFEAVEINDFKLPKFKISFGCEASDVLKSMGVKKAFFPGGPTEMASPPFGDELFVTGIFQKSFIEVDEKGTEAAAVTAIGCGCSWRYIPPRREEFIADHPFIFMISEDYTNSVLFIGYVMNPTVV